MIQIILSEGEKIRIESRKPNKAYVVLECVDGDIMNKTSHRKESE